MEDGNDSSAMTIEFLRARLLSERSVSRSARQRADQLAKRVTELEDQLRLVTIQRKKAEKAANEVLTILESQGIGNFCEVVDSSSDKDENRGVVIRTTESGNIAEEDNSSIASGMQNRSEVDDGCSGSEVEVSPSQGKSLSWKGSRDGSESLDRKKVIQTRQGMRTRAFIYSPEFSSKRQLGKSCRKLKRSGSMDVVANGKDKYKHLGIDIQGKENDELLAKDSSSGHVQDQQDACSGESTHGEDKLGNSTSVREQNNFFNSNFYASGVDKEEEMELALEKQAQLIDLYQAEENAQREWEEKFNENNSKMVSSQWEKNPALAESECEYVLMERAGNGNVSLIEGNSTEHTASAVRPDAILSEMISNEQMALTGYNGFDAPPANTNSNHLTSNGPYANTNVSQRTPTGETNGLLDQRRTGSTTIESETSSQEFEFPGQAACSGTPGKEPVNSCSNVSDRSLDLRSDAFKSVGNLIENNSSLNFSKEKLSETQIQIHRSSAQSYNSSLEVPQSCNNSLEVLGSLQRAKLSLHRQLNRVPQLTSKPWKAGTESRTLAIEQRVPNKGLDVPTGYASLFRLPTDPLPPSNLLGSTDIISSLDARKHYSDFGFTTNTDRHTEIRTHMRPQDYDYRYTYGSPLPPVDATRYAYPTLDSYPTRNISSIGTQIPHIGIYRASSQDPYFNLKIDGTGPSWRT